MIESILDLVGKTPVVKLHRVNYTGSNIFAKLESLNPSGSIKDVMADLAIPRKTLYDKMQKHGLDKSDYK